MRLIERSVSIADRSATVTGALAILAMVLATICYSPPCSSETEPSGTEETVSVSTLTSTPPMDYSPEVVKFTFQGKRMWQRVSIDDLDTLVAPSGEKLLPIKRMLRSIDVKPTESGKLFAFHVDGAPPVSIDLANQRVTIGEATATMTIIEAQSSITQQEDIYVPASSFAFMVAGDLVWDEQLYAYNCGLNRVMPMWRDFGTSMFSGKTQMIVPDLPEILPPAQPKKNGLDFVRLRLRSSADIVDPNSRSNSLSADDFTLDSWGSLGSGQLRVNLGMRPSGGSSARQDPIRLDLLEWTKMIGSAVVTAGDSRFGLNDLVLPYTNFTGLRIQGSSGGKVFLDQNSQSEQSTVQPRSFEGYAPVGSTVEIYVNDRLFDTQQVVALSADAPPGSGPWTFENVGIPGGRMSEVRIVVTDPSGNKTVSRQNVLASLMLEPKGRRTYTAGIGTNRNRFSFSETSGLLAAGRATLGLSDRLTVGLSASFSGGFYDRLLSDTVVEKKRVYPKSSSSIGGEFAWSPTNTMLLSGTTAFNMNIQKDNSTSSGAWAALLDCDLFAGKTTIVNGRLFHYGPSFFNGLNPALSDRSGFAFSSQHDMGRGTMTTAVGTVIGSSLDSADQKFKIGFQRIAVGTRLNRKSAFRVEMDRVSPGSGLRTNVMTSLAFNSEIARTVRLEVVAATGNALVSGFDSDLLEGLSLPLSLYESPRKAIGLSTSLGSKQSLSVQYRENMSYRRLTLTHNLQPSNGRSLLSRLGLHTEVGCDLLSKLPYMDGLIEYRPYAMSQSSLSLKCRYQDRELKVMLSANSSELYGFCQQQPRRVTDSGIDPQNGAVNGVVFLDYDGNGIQESSEPGIGDIKVMNDNRRSSISGKSGYFILPVRSRINKQRVYLDMASVPATYSLSNGIQTACIAPGNLTQVSLGITPTHAITGRVVFVSKENEKRPLIGVSVFATKTGNNIKVSDSVTAGDGSFYLGDIRPGEYDVYVDNSTILENSILSEAPNHIVVPPAKDSQELQLGDIVVSQP